MRKILILMINGAVIATVVTLSCSPKVQNQKYMFWTAGRHWAVRSGDWKAVSVPDKEKDEKEVKWELYNLKDDPGETKNLANDNPEQLAKLVKYAFEAYKDPVGGKMYDQELYMKDHNINKPMPPRLK